MIYTITLNPAIDHTILTKQKLEIGLTNYYNQEYKLIGGKGINCAIVLNNLQVPVLALGILGKENKDIFINEFKKINLNNLFFQNNGLTRTNYKIKNLSFNQEIEINGIGFDIENNILNNLIDYLKNNLKSKDILILTGSVAKGVNDNIYQEIGKIANEKNVTLICDASKILLKNVLKEKPFLIKPNLEEICATLEVEYEKNMSLEKIKTLVNLLKEKGAQNILLSMGSNGSLYFDSNNKIYKISCAKGELVNSVGAGDSMLAGFVYGYYKNLSIEECLKYASASGSATAFNQWLANKKEIENLLNQVEIKII